MTHDEFKARLLSEQNELHFELEKIAKQDTNTQDWVALPPTEEMINADENVEADAAEEWAERRAIVAELETRIRNVIRALNKIEDGTYGVCEISGEKIEEDRLNANPAARTNKANMDREDELTN